MHGIIFTNRLRINNYQKNEIMNWLVFKNILLYCAMIMTLSYCSSTKLEEALEASGENRPELERVLKHYSDNNDSLKLRAAKFLIENMPGHYTIRGEKIDKYRETIDKDSCSYFYKKVLDMCLSHFVESEENSWEEEDITHIKSDYLIRHIDLCFELLYRYSWLDMIAFDDFLEYVLPYRFENERLDLWRDSLHVYDNNMPSGRVGDYFHNSCSGLVARFKLKESTKSNTQIRKSLLQLNSMGDCYLNAHYNMFEQRSLGIPSLVDFVLFYTNRNGYHYWSNEPSVLFNKTYLDLVFDRRPGKIYRKTYSKNEIVKPVHDEYIPPFFTDPFIKDVTNLYCPTARIDVDANKSIHEAPYHAYLCVFNNLSWKPIAASNIKHRVANFPRISKHTVYLPVYYKNNGDEQVYNYPFILNYKGEQEYLIPDTIKRQRLHLIRKNPDKTNSLPYYMNKLKKCIVEASINKAFIKADTVFKFAQANHEYLIDVVNCLENKTYTYYKISTPEQAHVAEIYFYDEHGDKLSGDIIANQYDVMSDGDPLTFAVINEFNPLIVKFDHPVKISRIICLPRSDGNGIYPDNTYELLYFDLDGWRSLGMKKADDFYLEYNNVPSNALYWLRNWTTGVEERIFTYYNNIQLFW